MNDQHPERNADAVLLLDTFADDRHGSSRTLDRAVRAACSLTTAMLTARDRVGVVSIGGSTDWVTPGLGERARWIVVEHLLDTTPRWTDAERSLRWLPAAALPPRALVVVLSPLFEPRIVQIVVDLRRRGHDVAVVVLEADRLAGVSPTASRLWELELDRRRRVLEALGVRVAPANTDDALALVVARLDRARVRTGAGRARR